MLQGNKGVMIGRQRVLSDFPRSFIPALKILEIKAIDALKPATAITRGEYIKFN
jgi:hypothetical protein